MVTVWSGASGSLGAELTESQTTWRVFLAAGGLVLLGVVLLVATVWWWRSTRPEPPALGPLEVMSDRRWVSAAEIERRRLLDEHRPEGAVHSGTPEPEPVDLSLLARDVPADFDDLRDPVEPPPDRVVDPEAAELAARADDAADPSPTSDPADADGTGAAEEGAAEEGAAEEEAAETPIGEEAVESDAVEPAPAGRDVAPLDADDDEVDATVAMPSPAQPSGPRGRG